MLRPNFKLLASFKAGRPVYTPALKPAKADARSPYAYAAICQKSVGFKTSKIKLISSFTSSCCKAGGFVSFVIAGEFV